MRRSTLSILAAATALASLAVLAVFSLLSGGRSAFSFSSQSALWLAAWGLLCLLGISAWVLLSRLRAVRDEGARYREMVQEVNAFITRIAEDGTILFMNRYALEFFGWEVEEIIGRNVCGTLIPERDSAGRDMSGLWREINARDCEQYVHENENQRRDGSRVFISWTNRWVEGERPGKRVVLSVGNDCTQTRLQAEELHQAKERAEAADRTKSMVLSNITHEIRTPLNGVLGMLQILLMTDLNEKQVEHVNTAMNSAKDLGGIIDAILKFSEVDSSADQVLVQPFSLLNTIVGVVEAHRRDAEEKGLALDVRAEPGTVEALEGDGGRLRRIVDILVGNAVKFTQQGSIVLSVGTENTDRPGELELVLRVLDTGVGIARDRLPTILSGFEQGDQTYSRRFGGLGLGLCMARRLAETMGGEVSIESEEGRGTKASVRLRMQALSESMGGSVPTQAPRRAGGGAPRVLLALGNAIDSVALKFYLESRAVDVLLAPDPARALDVLARAQTEGDVDMAVFNVNGREGQAVLGALRDSGLTPTAPLVLLGGRPEEVCDMTFVVRCAAYPAVPSELWDLLLSVLS